MKITSNMISYLLCGYILCTEVLYFDGNSNILINAIRYDHYSRVAIIKGGAINTDGLLAGKFLIEYTHIC